MQDYLEWIEFLGKILIFASFWFVAPEIAGEERLRNLSKATLAMLATLAGMLGWLATLLLIWAVLRGILPPSVNPFAPPDLHIGQPPGNLFLTEIRRVIGPIMMALALGAGRLSRGWVEQRFVQPLVRRLSESESLRSMWLRIGVWMFVVGSVFDMGWWLWDKKVGKLLGLV